MSEIGQWKEAREAVKNLSDEAFADAGGDGHSRSNTLWFIATRPLNNQIQQ